MMKRLASYFLGGSDAGQLPERVRQAIEAQQARSETLIAWVQLFAVIFFGLLYAVSPKTSGGTMFMPVPWAIGIYFLFTVARLYAATRERMPAFLPVISVVLDILLLLVLIWSFHLQYEQPAAFYLKAPTMLYLFIFISLRVLRFDPRYVILAGLAAAAGWLGLFIYALAVGDGMDSLITRDYVHYMTSNSVLIGAEVDRIISILAVTAILALALARARRLLNQAVLDATAARDLSRFVTREVADHIKAADQEIQPGAGETRWATVMFVDVEGFSTHSENMTPTQVMSMLNDYFVTISDVLAQRGGVMTQFQGDAMLVTFNAIKPDPDHAANAVRGALEVQNILASRLFDGIRLKARCGINTGDMVAGAVGSRDHLLFTVHGDEVNVAARLEQVNKDYGTYVLASEQTMREAGDAFRFTRVDEIIVRGRAAPTSFYSVSEGQP
jgi:adenylate cyclase